MGRTPNGENGYMPGVQCPFTPSRKATWTGTFNSLLEQEGISRNKLTEKLIQEALENRGKRVVTFDCSELSVEEAELLQNPVIQKMVIQMIRSLSNQIPFPTSPTHFNSTVQQGNVNPNVLPEVAATQETVAAIAEKKDIGITKKEQGNNINSKALERYRKIKGTMNG
ncbi:MAG TPA: hypothetical protein VEY70_08775 [Metabacillus sp.]|nr:hypothetical protein [Metabacillus sp.]